MSRARGGGYTSLMTRRKPRRAGPARKPGSQGLESLGTYRIPFSADVKRRAQQTRENRRPHRLRGGAGRPDSVLGAPELHWSSPPRLPRGSFADLTAPGSEPKVRGEGPAGGNVLDWKARKRRGQRGRRG